MLYVLIGFAGGIVSGMGLGGGTLLIPLLALFCGMAQHEAQGANLVAYIPAAIAALCIHRQNHEIDVDAFKGSIIPGLIGAACGTAMSLRLNSDLLRKGFAALLLLLAASQLIAGEKKHIMERGERNAQAALRGEDADSERPN